MTFVPACPGLAVNVMFTFRPPCSVWSLPFRNSSMRIWIYILICRSELCIFALLIWAWILAVCFDIEMEVMILPCRAFPKGAMQIGFPIKGAWSLCGADQVKRQE